MVAGNLLVSRTHFHHNRTFLTILLFGLTLLPVGRVLSVDAWLARRRGRPLVDDVRLWPLWLLRVQVSLVYVASGTSKLVDPDWFGGLVMWDRVVRRRHHLEPTPLPDVGDRLADRALAVLRPRTRDRAHRAVHRSSGCGTGARGSPRCGSPSRST